MANPRYQRNERPSRREEKMTQALSFAGLAQDQQQIQDRAQNARVAQALQLLGLQQQQQQDQLQNQRAMQALGLQEQGLGIQKDQLGFEREKFQGEGQREGDRNKRMLDLALLGFSQNQPGLDPAVGNQFAGMLSPDFRMANENAVKTKRDAEMKALGLDPATGQPPGPASSQANPITAGFANAVTAPLLAPKRLYEATAYTPPPPTSDFGGAALHNFMQLLNYLQRR